MPSGAVRSSTVPSGLVPPAAPQGRSAPDVLTENPELAALAAEASGCTRCRLAQGRTQVVFGVGNPHADLVFVGEAPGFHEDQQGFPFVGAAGKLLDRLLGDIGLTRRDVYIANVLMCRPPGNRDPMPDEIEACEGYLFRKIQLIEPRIIATLGNFATKLLSGKQYGITKVHGQPQPAQVGGLAVTLYPLYHPAAALYTPAMLRTLEEDFSRLPGLLAVDAPAAAPEPEALELDATVIPFPATAPVPAGEVAAAAEQLELF
jgi:DNA polymerase